MESLKNTNHLSCEQIYQIWRSEPELVQIYDLRDRAEYSQQHIPGAIHIGEAELHSRLSLIGNRLAVLLASEAQKDILKTTLQAHQNYVFFESCDAWFKTNKPVAERSVETLLEDYQNKKSEGFMQKDIIFHQLYEAESSTYTYIIADRKTKEAAIIDPVLETVDRDLKLINELELKLVYVLDTHIHADHVTGAGEIRKRTQAKSAVSREAQVKCVDIELEDGQELLLGDKKIKVISTPGHTNTCLTYAFEGMIFTGDALLIRGCGRTDFQQGSSEKLYSSVRDKIFSLPDETVIYPGHDYRGMTSSTIALEKNHNPRLKLSVTKTDFVKIMSELKLAHPKKIHEALPANMACGLKQNDRIFHPQNVDGIPEVSVEDVFLRLNSAHAGNIKLIDVRADEEFTGELGHVPNSKLFTLGPKLTEYLQSENKESEIVFICRSGGRSGQATAESIRLGFKKTANMAGGMIRWNEARQPVEK